MTEDVNSVRGVDGIKKPTNETKDTTLSKGCEECRKYYCMLKYFNAITLDQIDTLNTTLAGKDVAQLQNIVAHEVISEYENMVTICSDQYIKDVLDGVHKRFIQGGKYVGKTQFLKVLERKIGAYISKRKGQFSNGHELYVKYINAPDKLKKIDLYGCMMRETDHIENELKAIFRPKSSQTIYLLDNFDKYCREALLPLYSLESVNKFRKRCFNFFKNSNNPTFLVSVETSLLECFDYKMPMEYKRTILNLNGMWPQLTEKQIINIILRALRIYFEVKTSELEGFHCHRNNGETCSCSVYFDKDDNVFFNDSCFLKETIKRCGAHPYWVVLPLSHSLHSDESFVGNNNAMCYDETIIKRYYFKEEVNGITRKQDVFDDYFETLALYIDLKSTDNKVKNDIREYVKNNDKILEKRAFENSLKRIKKRFSGTQVVTRNIIMQFLLDSNLITKKIIMHNGSSVEKFEVQPFIKYICSEVK